MMGKCNSNHKGVEKMRLLACESIYWIGINADIKKHVKELFTMSLFMVNAAKGEIDTP